MSPTHFALLLAWFGALAGPFAAWLLMRWMPARLHGGFVLAFVTVYGLGVWTFLIEPRLWVVREVEIASPTWTGPPLRIGLVSDTHAGAPYGDAARTRAIVGALNRAAPEVIVLLGDYAGQHEPAAVRSSRERSQVMAGLSELSRLRAPLGRFAVLGNHDWWYDGPAIEAELTRRGVPVLENRAVRVARPSGAFWIAGLADVDSLRANPSPARALSGVPASEPVVVLSHWPDPFPLVPRRAAVTFAGHTHCGQVNLPLFGRLLHASKGSARWPCGLYVEDGKSLFVTGGTGVSILPVRFSAMPEVVVVTLRQGQPEPRRGGMSARR